MTESKADNKSLPPIVKDDEIDLVALFLNIWEGRKLILKVTAAVLALGLLIALTSPVRYSAGVKMIPESNKSMNLGSLGGLAAQFGLSAASLSTEGGAIPPDYYPEIVQSVPYLKLLMYQPFNFGGEDSISLYDYYHQEMNASLLGSIKKYTIGLPWQIKKWIVGKPDDEGVSRVEGNSVLRLSEEEREVLEWLQESLSLSISKEIGMISLQVEMPGAEMAAEVASYAARLLSDYAVSYKTDKAREDLRFVEERFKEVEARFEKSRKALARFRDSSHGNLTALAQSEEESLQSEYDLAFSLYTSLATQYEQARIKLQEETPVVSIIEPAVVPDEKSAPRRSMIMIVSLFLGLFAGIGLLFGLRLWGDFKEKVSSYI